MTSASSNELSVQYREWPSKTAELFWKCSLAVSAEHLLKCYSMRSEGLPTILPVTLVVFFILILSIKILPDRFNDIQITTLWRPFHKLQNCLILFSFQVSFKFIRGVFGIVILLESKTWTN